MLKKYLKFADASRKGNGDSTIKGINREIIIIFKWSVHNPHYVGIKNPLKQCCYHFKVLSDCANSSFKMWVYYFPIVFIVLVYAVYRYFTRNFNYWKSRNVPGPKPTVLFGNLKESALRKKNLGVVIQELYDMFPNEKVVGVYTMTSPTLLIRDLDIVKHVLIKDFDTFTDRGMEFSKEGLGQNLFSADGETWAALRNRFTPIFTSGKLKNMFYLILMHL